MTSIDDIARHANVASSTVSRALRGLPSISEATRKRVQESAIALNYIPSASASGLASGRTMAIGVVVPMVAHWFYSNVIEGIDDELRPAGYDMVLFNLDGQGNARSRVFRRSMLRRRTDALIVMNLAFTAEERLELKESEHPTIVIGGSVRGLPRIGIDENVVARTATQHLIELGHTDIAFLGSEPRASLNPDVPRGRMAGFEHAMADAGLAVRDEWMIRAGDFDLETGRAKTSELLESGGPLPSAIFAAADDMAIGALLAMLEHGLRAPDDISVIGIDDHVWASSFGLTTMAQDPREQGRSAARALLAELGGDPPKRLPRARVTLVERTSTGPPRGR
jgi:DNA-binding LacI/PurR family transcriptional regulator